MASFGDAAQIAANQRDSGTFDSDTRPSPHGDADVRRRKGRGIVDAVASHGDDMAFNLKPLYDVQFVLRQHFSVYFLDSQLFANLFGICAPVTSQHNNAHSIGAKVT